MQKSNKENKLFNNKALKMKGLIEQSVEQIEREKNFANARGVLQRLGQRGIEDFLQMVGVVDIELALGMDEGDQSVGKKTHLKLVSGVNSKREDLIRDLRELGIKIPERSKIEVCKTPQIKKINTEFFRLHLDEALPRYSQRELQILLAQDFPDIQARNEIIALFFEGHKFSSHIAISMVETLREIDGVLQNSGEEVESIRNNIISIGNEFEAVEKLKIKRETKRNQIMGFSHLPEIKDFPIVKKSRNVSQVDQKEYVVNQREKMEEFVKSTFCYCVAQLSQTTGALMWAADSEKFIFDIPDWVSEKMELIKSVSAYYEFTDYSAQLKPSVRAFLRVYNGMN